MFSKRLGYVFMASLMTLTSVGCTDFLKGKKAEPEVIEFADARFVCLQKVPLQIKKFSIGDAQEEDIRTGIDCISEALRYFNKRTFGSQEGSYTVEEMRKFFGKYFLKQNNVSPAFAAELMKIKKALLGGSATYITKEEIVRVIEILGVVREELVELAPHIKTLLLQPTEKKPEWENVSAATEQFRLSTQRILNQTQIAKSDYSFEDVKRALAGFAEFIKGEEPFAPYERYGSWVPLVEAIKNVLMGQRAHFTDTYQWSEALNTLVDLYELALKYHYSLQEMNISDMARIRQATQFFGQTLKLVQNAHQMKTTGVIPLEDLDNLIVQILARFEVGVSEKALKKTYRAVLIKILDPERKMDSRSLLGLEKKHLASLEREFNIWRLQQSFIDSLPFALVGGGLKQNEILTYFQRFRKTAVIEKGLSTDPFEQRALEYSWEDFGDLLRSPVPVVFSPSGRLLTQSQLNEVKQTWQSLTRANIMRALSRMLLLGYGENTHQRLQDAGMTQAGLISWYDDFQELGLELKAFDPRSANSGARSFLEANFFTFSGNGNNLMDHKETYEFVSTLFSAGLATSGDIQRHMGAAKCEVAEKDVFGLPYLKEDCFKGQLKNHFSVFFDNLPGMHRYVNSLSPAQWDEFYRYLAAASEVVNQKKGFVETANIRSMVMILHYIESVMILYDKDRSQGLSLDEVYSASPRFVSFFRTMTGTQSETLLKEGFAYLVFKGAIPDAGDLAGFQWSKLWGLDEARRLEIIRLFGVLKDQLNKDKN